MNTVETPKKNGTGNGKAKANPTNSLEHRQILSALRAFKRGDFTIRLREDLAGVDG